MDKISKKQKFRYLTYRLGGDCSIQLSYEGVGFCMILGIYPVFTHILNKFAFAIRILSPEASGRTNCGIIEA